MLFDKALFIEFTMHGNSHYMVTVVIGNRDLSLIYLALGISASHS